MTAGQQAGEHFPHHGTLPDDDPRDLALQPGGEVPGLLEREGADISPAFGVDDSHK